MAFTDRCEILFWAHHLCRLFAHLSFGQEPSAPAVFDDPSAVQASHRQRPNKVPLPDHMRKHVVGA